MLRRSSIIRKSVNGLQRTAFKRRAPKKRPGYHEPKYLAACKGEPCYLQLPAICRGADGLETVVPAHRNQGKGMGLKVPDEQTVPACFWCHTAYDQSGLPREIKRAAFDWAYTRWSQVRVSKMNEGASHGG